MNRRWGKRGKGTRNDAESEEDPFELSGGGARDPTKDPPTDLPNADISHIDLAFDPEGDAVAAANNEWGVDILLFDNEQKSVDVHLEEPIDSFDESPSAPAAAQHKVFDDFESLSPAEPVADLDEQGLFVGDFDPPADAAESISPNSSEPPEKSKTKRQRRSWRFELLALFGLVLIWSLVFAILKYMPPSYKSSWTIMIPGTTFGSSINLDNLTSANTSVGSQYGSKAIDPKVNYKSIALSPVVMEEAARRVGLDVEDFGLPKVSLVDQTTMMMITTKADSAEFAQQKSQSLYDAFHDQLDKLRMGERDIKQRENEEQLESYRAAADKALAELQAFRGSTEVVYAEQYKTLATRMGEVQDKRRDAEVRLASLNAKYEAVQKSLGMSPAEAGQVLRLRQDVLLQSQLEAYATAHAGMVELEAVLGARHPKVVHARSRSSLAYQALMSRAADVVGSTSADMLKQLMPNAQADDVLLYQELIRLEAEKLGIESEMQGLDQSLPRLRSQILRYADDASKLEKLQTNHKIARTILVSATSRIDLANSDIYASYPMTQELVLPTLPKKPGRLAKLFVVLGGLAGSGLIFLALIVYWNRDRWRRLIQKSA